MRKILFRGKRIDTGEWIVGGYYWDNLHDYHYIFVDADEDTFRNRAIQVIPETVGQYTGLTDANGIGIYENDIIRIQNYSTKWKHGEPSGDWRIFEVRWNRYLWSLRNPWIAIPLSDYDTGTLEPWHIEVIGDTYENSDILKEVV